MIYKNVYAFPKNADPNVVKKYKQKKIYAVVRFEINPISKTNESSSILPFYE